MTLMATSLHTCSFRHANMINIVNFSTEHEKHQPYCEFVKLNKPEDDYTVRDWLRLLAYANSTHQVC